MLRFQTTRPLISSAETASTVCDFFRDSLTGLLASNIESSSSRVRPLVSTEEIKPSSLYQVPYNINYVNPLPNLLQSNGCTIRVDEFGNIEGEIVEPHAFSTSICMQTFDRIGYNEWIDATTVEDADEEDKCDCQIGYRLWLTTVVLRY